MKPKVKNRIQDFGRYLIEYRNEVGDLYFYKREKVDDFDTALKVKDVLEQSGFFDIRIINKELLQR